jgi:hypothetical protein
MGNRVLCGGSLAIVNALKGQSMSMKPKWKHYCTECKYIGTVLHDAEILDWYTCGQGGLGDTILARFAGEDSDGSAYYSMSVPIESTVAQDSEGNRGYVAIRLLAEAMLRKVHTV